MKNYFLKKVISLFILPLLLRIILNIIQKKCIFFPGGVNFEKFSKFSNTKKKEKILYIGEVKI